MKFSMITALHTVLLGVVLALPSPKDPDVVPAPFLLKTVAVNGTKYDDMYIIPGHTFAGGNAPGVFHDGKYAVPAYLENSRLYFEFGKEKYNQYPFRVEFTDYAQAWYAATIDVGEPHLATKSFGLDNRNFLISTLYGKGKYVKESYNREFHGAYWRVCKWSHGYPELFFNNPGNSNNPHPKYVPDICGLVNIKAVAK